MNKTNRHRVLIIGGRDHTFERLTEMEIEYVVFQWASLVSEFLLENAEQLWVGDYEDLNKVLPIARVMHQYRPFDAVISFAEYGFWPAAQIAKALEITSNCQSEVVILTRDKLAMRQRMDQAGLDNIPYRMVLNEAELADFIDKYGESIVKPCGGGGSEGVTFVDANTYLPAVFSRANEVGRGSVLVEKFVGGDEYSVETISRNGEHEVAAITAKITTGAPYFVECGHFQPAQLSKQIQDSIQAAVTDLLTVVGYQTGPAHTEVKVEHGRVYIIETQIRNGGDQIWELTLNTCGIDLFKETFASLFELPTPIRTSRSPAQAILFLTPNNLTVTSLEGVDAASRAAGVERVSISAKIGQRFDEINHSGTRAGYVLASGQDSNDALDKARKAIALIEIK